MIKISRKLQHPNKGRTGKDPDSLAMNIWVTPSNKDSQMAKVLANRKGKENGLWKKITINVRTTYIKMRTIIVIYFILTLI